MSDARRRAVWVALSELFLDTDEADAVVHVAQVCQASGYDLQTLEVILRDEVLPVCGWNAVAPVGVWSGFDETDLIARIETVRARRRLFGPAGRVWRGWMLARLVPAWAQIRARLADREP